MTGATRKLYITCATHIIFLLDSSVLELSPILSGQFRICLEKWALSYWSQIYRDSQVVTSGSERKDDQNHTVELRLIYKSICNIVTIMAEDRFLFPTSISPQSQEFRTMLSPLSLVTGRKQKHEAMAETPGPPKH